MTDHEIHEPKPDVDVPCLYLEVGEHPGWVFGCPECGNMVGCPAWVSRCCPDADPDGQLVPEENGPGNVHLLADEGHDPTPCQRCGDPADVRVFGGERSVFLCADHLDRGEL